MGRHNAPEQRKRYKLIRAAKGAYVFRIFDADTGHPIGLTVVSLHYFWGR